MSDLIRLKQERDNLFASVVELEMGIEELLGRVPPIDPAIKKAMRRMVSSVQFGSSERAALEEHDASFAPPTEATPNA